MFSGLMLSQYTAGALVAENRVLSTPAAAGSIPAAADQEDFVSMGMTTAIKTRQIIENCWQIVAIELMAAAQAFDFRAPVRPAPATQAAYEKIRRYVPRLDEDRPLHNDIHTLSSRMARYWKRQRTSSARWSRGPLSADSEPRPQASVPRGTGPLGEAAKACNDALETSDALVELRDRYEFAGLVRHAHISRTENYHFLGQAA
jgi:hypothetical protein